jgi:hypothetical protein
MRPQGLLPSSSLLSPLFRRRPIDNLSLGRYCSQEQPASVQMCSAVFLPMITVCNPSLVPLFEFHQNIFISFMAPFRLIVLYFTLLVLLLSPFLTVCASFPVQTIGPSESHCSGFLYRRWLQESIHICQCSGACLSLRLQSLTSTNEDGDGSILRNVRI